MVGTTDTENVPMRRAFERAGFTVTKRRIVFEAGDQKATLQARLPK